MPAAPAVPGASPGPALPPVAAPPAAAPLPPVALLPPVAVPVPPVDVVPPLPVAVVPPDPTVPAIAVDPPWPPPIESEPEHPTAARSTADSQDRALVLPAVRGASWVVVVTRFSFGAGCSFQLRSMCYRRRSFALVRDKASKGTVSSSSRSNKGVTSPFLPHERLLGRAAANAWRAEGTSAPRHQRGCHVPALPSDAVDDCPTCLRATALQRWCHSRCAGHRRRIRLGRLRWRRRRPKREWRGGGNLDGHWWCHRQRRGPGQQCWHRRCWAWRRRKSRGYAGRLRSERGRRCAWNHR